MGISVWIGVWRDIIKVFLVKRPIRHPAQIASRFLRRREYLQSPKNWLIKKYIVWVLIVFAFALSFPVLALSWDQDAKDVWINDLAFCESQYRDVTVLDTNDKYSYGVLQFQMGTWLAYGKAFGATADNIHESMIQHAVARSMLDAGLESQWKTCSAKVTKQYGAYPSW